MERIIFKNVTWSLVSYAVTLINSFICRRFLVKGLGLEYAGIEGIFLNIVTSLSVVELGIGKGFVYKLFKPLRDKNFNRISMLLRYFKKSYNIILTFIIVLASGSLFFLVKPILNLGISKLIVISIFYILEIIFSYLFAVKRTLLMADVQNYYYINLSNVCVRTCEIFFQYFSLLVFKSFFLYLLFKVLFIITENFMISYFFDLKYSEVKNFNNDTEINLSEKKEIIKTLIGFLCHKVSGFMLTASSSFVIMKFVALEKVGIYANYSLVIIMILNFTKEIFNGISVIFGNKLSISKNLAMKNFDNLFFINFLIYSVIAGLFFNMINPLIFLWLGKHLIFEQNIIILLTIYIYIYGMRQTIMMAKSTAGIYNQDKYWGILGTVFSVMFYFLLGPKYGIFGVLLGTILGLIIVPCWSDPFFVYSFVFKEKPFFYHRKYILYSLITFFYTCISNFLIKIFEKSFFENSVVEFFLEIIICSIIPLIFNFIIFHRKVKTLLS